MRIVQLFLFVVPVNVGDFYLLCCFCWLNWTANQSCFSPLSLFFILQQKGGAVPSVVQKDMFAADFIAEMEQNREECEQQGI